MKTALCLTVALLVTCLAASSMTASAVPTSGGWDPDNTLPTFDAVEMAAERARAERCRTPSCQAIEAIDGLMKIDAYVDDNANMTGRPGRLLYSPVVVWHRLRRVLLDRPDLYEPFCATSVRLLESVSPDPYEITVPVTLLDESVDVDLRTHGHCAKDMVAALLKSPATDQVRRNAEFLCEHPDDRHPRPKAACETLVKGLPVTR